MKQWLRTKTAVVALMTVAAAGTIGGISIASESNDGIDACVDRVSGLARILIDDRQCLATEAPVSWARQGPAGPPGAAGPAGPSGAEGPPGAQGPSGLLSTRVVSHSDSGPVAGSKVSTVRCAPGEVAVSGGYEIDLNDAYGDIWPKASRPLTEGGRSIGWQVNIYYRHGVQTPVVTVYAVCGAST